MNRDPYEVLELSRDASKDDIASAYRRLARSFHPDANPGPDQDKTTEKFKEVAQAYEILGDPDRRAQFDRYGTTGKSGHHGFGFQQRPEDMFSSAFRHFFDEGGQAQVRGTRVRLTIDLVDAFKGCKKSVKVEDQKRCEPCKGTGATSWTRCSDCGGSGMRSMQAGGNMVMQSTCVPCGGRGQVPESMCEKCQSTGFIKQGVRKVEVEVPVGIETNTQIRVPDEGVDGTDLYVLVVVRPHKTIKRDGRNLFTEVVVPYTQLVLGGETEVDTLDKPVKLKVKPNTQSGVRYRLRGEGMPSLRSPQKGDLFVSVQLKMPGKLTKEYKALLAKLAKLEKK